jgi:UDP-N-acetylglucosamine 3-dehydrogenase
VSARAEPVGVLFLGCGWAASIHSRVLRRLGGRAGPVTLSYASRDGARAEAHRRRYGGRRAFAAYEAGLADPAVTVVMVTTPPATHRALALQALEAGKHVIVEKPAFLRAADADVVRAAAAAAGRRVFVAENYVYKPIAAHLRRLVAAGDLGEVRFVSVNATKRQPARGWRADPALAGGGALFEAGVHWISFATNLGLDVEAVDAYRVGGGAGADRARSSCSATRTGRSARSPTRGSWPRRSAGSGSRRCRGPRAP